MDTSGPPVDTKRHWLGEKQDRSTITSQLSSCPIAQVSAQQHTEDSFVTQGVKMFSPSGYKKGLFSQELPTSLLLVDVEKEKKQYI